MNLDYHVNNWFKRYEEIIPEFNEFLKTLFIKPLRAIRVNTTRVKPKLIYDALIELGFNINPHPTLSYIYYSSDAKLGKTIYHELGYYYLEDLVSTLPPIILLKNIGNTSSVIDLTAAPGGKCTHMAQILYNKPYHIIANDINKKRINILIRNIERLALTNIIITNYDARKYPFIRSDRIMLDAPCSSETLIYEMSISEIKMLYKKLYIKYSKIQREIIKRAYQIQPENGLLLYSVCTIAPEESEAIINYAINLGYKVEKLSNIPFKYIPGIDSWKINGKTVVFDSSIKRTIRIYPHLNLDEYGGSIGYLYIALLKKVG